MRLGAAFLGLAAMTALLMACEGPGFLASAVAGGKKIKPAYVLPDRPTLVMVDDPNQALGNPILTGVVAAHVAHHLAENGAVKKPFISQKKLAEVRDSLGKRFDTTPVDEVGRLTGAEQVIFINIEGAALQPAPSFYRPTAYVEIKVVDAAAGKRMYPEPPPILEPGAPSRGRSLEVSFRYKGLAAESPGQDAVLTRRLAERIGLQVARLFFEHKPDPKFNEER